MYNRPLKIPNLVEFDLALMEGLPQPNKLTKVARPFLFLQTAWRATFR